MLDKAQEIVSAHVVATMHLQRQNIPTRVSPRTHRPSFASEVAAREKVDGKYRGEMSNARQYLAQTFLPGNPASLAKLRLQRGLSQAELARIIQSSQPHIAKIEAGSIKIYWDTAIKLADALNVSLDMLRPLIDGTQLKTETGRSQIEFS